MTRTPKIIYWIATIWLSFGMLSSATVQLLRVADAGDGVTRLGYPTYLLTILGVWKSLGIVIILVPKLPLVKEWAYDGLFFVASERSSRISYPRPDQRDSSLLVWC